MPKIYSELTQLIGNTPLLELKRVEENQGLRARILAKIEYFNPGGSVKDRIALAMIEDAEKSGKLKPGGLIIEPTSGNTGVGIAWVAKLKGYKPILTMPETMSEERKKLLRAYGATLVLTPGNEGMKGAISRAREIQAENPGSIILQQFDNPVNPDAHFRTTGQEIWRDTDGKIDIFVAGVGTGGTLSGTAKALKSHNPAIKTIGVEPASSPVLSGAAPGTHKIQGIGAGFVPANFKREYVDEIDAVTDEEAAETTRLLAREEGLLVGISSGAAMAAAIRHARMQENTGKTIVVLLPDTGERYLSTPLFP